MGTDRDVYREVVRLQEAGERGVLCVVTRVEGSAPQVVGAKMVVREDGSIVGTVGGGAFEHRVVAAALEALAEGAPRTVAFRLGVDLGMCCGGSMEAYLEPLVRRERLVVFGGGHVARPVAAMAKWLGFSVVVVDDRPEWANPERFPDADEIHNDEFVDYLDRNRFGPTDHLLIVTRGHEHDQAILERVVGGPQAWLGMIGSRRKVALSFQRLRAKGVPEEAIARVEAPVGLDLGAVSPAEIAVSIVARLVQVRRGGASSPAVVRPMAARTAPTTPAPAAGLGSPPIPSPGLPTPSAPSAALDDG